MRRAIPASAPDGRDSAASSQHAVGQPAASRLPAWLRENLEHSLPFLLAGALCIGLAVWLGASHPYAIGSRLSLWVLLAAVGVTLGGGGLALTLVDEAPTGAGPGGADDYVVVERSEWAQWQQDRPPPVRGLGVAPATTGVTASGLAPGFEPAGPAPAAMPAPYDPTLVASVSDDLLRSVGTTASSTEAGPVRGVTEASQPWLEDVPRGANAPTGSKVGPERGVAAAAVGPTAPSVPTPPVWQEDPIGELESVLAQVQRDVAPATAPRQAPAAIDRCISCGASVTSYSEQACVVCDRPLCDRCLELSVVEGRPAICPFCPRPQGT